MKITLFTTLFIAFVALSSCNQNQNPSSNNEPQNVSESNNWTKDQKETILMISKSSANASEKTLIRNHADEIARKTLQECMSAYPKYEDFSYTKKFWYDIYKKTSNSYLK